jgi:phospholipid/cholesterol/gamma-HCH transport system substrate-binding protein
MGDSEKVNDQDSEQSFSPESKVGLFVLAGLAVLMISVLMLGDIHFRPQNQIQVIFRNVEGITDKSPVKIYGVEVGSVKSVELAGDHAIVKVALRKDLQLFKNAKARIRSTGIIGSKFLSFDPGAPRPGMPPEDEKLGSGDTIMGQDTLSLDELMERVAKSLDDFTDNGRMGKNLGATIANLRSITDSLNAALGQQRQSLIKIVQNVEGFSAYAKSAAAHLDEVLTSSKEDVKVALHNLKETLEKSNAILGQVQRGEGTIGALLTDKKTGDDVKETVANLKQTSESAKEVMARFTKVRAFWIVQGRRDFKAAVYRADLGIRLEPRPNKFYEILVQNVGDEGSMEGRESDFERPNSITGVLGRHWGPFTGAIGFIKSRGGVEGRFRPFQSTEVPVVNNLELVGQAFDLGRDSVYKGRKFTEPNYTAGARVKVNQWVTAGVQVEDIAEVSHLHGLVNVSFEDRDIAYLLGFVSFAR